MFVLCMCVQTRGNSISLPAPWAGSVYWLCRIMAVSCKWMNRTSLLLEECRLILLLFFFHIFTLLTCLSITTEFLNDAVWRKGIEWNGVIVGTRMRLKRESFTMGMFSTDVVQNQMPSELVKFQKLWRRHWRRIWLVQRLSNPKFSIGFLIE